MRLTLAPCGFSRTRAGVCPQVFYGSVRFDDAIDRADADTLWRIVMALAFNTGSLINHIGDAIAFADGFSRAFGYACAAGDAVFGDFHCHDVCSICEFTNLRYTLRFCMSNDDCLAFAGICNKS